MKIVVNTRLLRKNEMDGIGWFTFNTLQYIVKQNPHIEFHFLFDSGIEQAFLFERNVVPHNLFPPAKHALLNIAWFEVSVKRVLQKLNPSLFLSPDGILCLGWDGPQYGVIHDINFYHNPSDLKWSNQKYYNHFFPKYARQAKRIGTVSEYSKNDIINTYKIDPHKIDVVYNGVNHFFKPISLEEQRVIKEKYTGGADYFVFIGTLHPRKNIIRLLQAFDLFKKESGAAIKLVIAGKNLYKAGEMHSYHQQMEYRQDVLFTGRIDDSHLNALLGAALALTFVPTFEGFGIPIIEAMQCGVPIICANTTSMPEVAGDAAIIVNPFDVVDIKNAMVKIQADAALRSELIHKGNERSHFFTWQKTAQLLWAGVEKCL